MSEATFADSEKQDCPPPTSHYGQICCCYRAAQAALPYGHQSNRVTEAIESQKVFGIWSSAISAGQKNGLDHFNYTKKHLCA